MQGNYEEEELSWGDIVIYFAMMLAVAVILSVYIFGVAFLLETVGINRYAGITVAILALMVGLYIYGRRMRDPY